MGMENMLLQSLPYTQEDIDYIEFLLYSVHMERHSPQERIHSIWHHRYFHLHNKLELYIDKRREFDFHFSTILSVP